MFEDIAISRDILLQKIIESKVCNLCVGGSQLVISLILPKFFAPHLTAVHIATSIGMLNRFVT